MTRAFGAGTHGLVLPVPVMSTVMVPVGIFALATPLTITLKVTLPPAVGEPELTIVTKGSAFAIVITGADKVTGI